jgi:sterol desaturase/sphingolipid hydroxylase (fatty acid hydroxylase superfamily)
MFLVKLLVGLVVAAAVFVPLERLFRIRRQRVLRPGWRTDVVHFLVTRFLTQVVTIAVAAPFVVLGRFLLPDGIRGAVTGQATGLQIVELLVLVDVGAYFGHRLAHRVPWWWRLHRVHHSSEQLDWLAAPRVHPLDTGLIRAFGVVPAALLGFSAGSLGGAVAVLTFNAVLVHANVRLSFGPLRWVVTSPQFHHWHHAAHTEAGDTNFAGLLPVVDVVFGTAHLPRGAWPHRYGVDDGPVPSGYVRQLVQPVRELRRGRPGEPAAVELVG